MDAVTEYPDTYRTLTDDYPSIAPDREHATIDGELCDREPFRIADTQDQYACPHCGAVLTPDALEGHASFYAATDPDAWAEPKEGEA